MSYSFDGSNDNLTGMFASTYGDPLTIACFLKVTNHPVAIDEILYLGNSNASNNDSYGLRTSATDDHWIARATDSAGVSSIAEVTLNVDGAWTGMVGKFQAADTGRNIYFQTISTTDENTIDRIVADAIQYIRVGESLTGAGDYTGLLAEIAVWNTALSDADITSYLGGAAASGISAANLIGYWPLRENGILTNAGLDSGGDLTASGASFSSDHPVITGFDMRRSSLMLMDVG